MGASSTELRVENVDVCRLQYQHQQQQQQLRSIRCSNPAEYHIVSSGVCFRSLQLLLVPLVLLQLLVLLLLLQLLLLLLLLLQLLLLLVLPLLPLLLHLLLLLVLMLPPAAAAAYRAATDPSKSGPSSGLCFRGRKPTNLQIDIST
jgi:hypothetical protein